MRRLLLLAVLVSACTPRPRAAAGEWTAPDTVTLVVAATTDVHGALRGWDYLADAPDSARGLTRVATILDSLRAADPGRVILVDAGDLLQGTAIASIALRDSLSPNPIIAAMNALRYDAAAVGNHEFNYGVPYLERAVRQAAFPFLAANAFRPDGAPAFGPWVMVERAGVRVAIVGGTTPGSMIWDRDRLAGRIEVRLRGAQVVVAVLHSGLDGPSSYDTVATGVASENVAARAAREIGGIDLVVFGHSHRELADTTIGRVMLMQPRNGAASVAVARLTLVRGTEGYHVAAKRGLLVRARGHAEQPTLLAVTDDAHRRAVAFVRQPLGTTAVRWRADSARVKDTPILDFILEVQRRVAGTDLAPTSAFNLNAEFGPGPVTLADVAELYPYENNRLRAVRITGRQLRDYLEFSARYYRANAPPDSLVDPAIPGFNFDIVSGVDYVIDLTRPVGSRITSLTREGQAVTDGDRFTLALNDYRQSGGGGYAMLRGAPLLYEGQGSIRDLLIAEIRRAGTLDSAQYFRRNWRLAPDGMEGAAYRSMRRLPYDRPRAPPPR